MRHCLFINKQNQSGKLTSPLLKYPILEYIFIFFVFWRIPECEISVPGAHVMFMVHGSNNTAFTLYELLT